MAVGEASLFLTSKGTEELRSRAHKLDFAARNILFLIQQGFTTAEAILQRSIFPRDAVSDKLRRLLTNEFVAVEGGPAADPRRAANAADTTDAATAGETPFDELVTLEDGISLAQARFALSDFCLDRFGVSGQDLVDAIDRCADLDSLQQVLGRIRLAVLERCRERLPELHRCVREINRTAI
jgi:hypothetical protein